VAIQINTHTHRSSSGYSLSPANLSTAAFSTYAALEESSDTRFICFGLYALLYVLATYFSDLDYSPMLVMYFLLLVCSVSQTMLQPDFSSWANFATIGVQSAGKFTFGHCLAISNPTWSFRPTLLYYRLKYRKKFTPLLLNGL
jgi:hypothetical protein